MLLDWNKPPSDRSAEWPLSRFLCSRQSRCRLEFSQSRNAICWQLYNSILTYYALRLQQDGKTPMCEAARKDCWNIVNKFLSATKAKTENQIKVCDIVLVAYACEPSSIIARYSFFLQLWSPQVPMVTYKLSDCCCSTMPVYGSAIW